jgi:hypothetical protein
MAMHGPGQRDLGERKEGWNQVLPADGMGTDFILRLGIATDVANALIVRKNI